MKHIFLINPTANKGNNIDLIDRIKEICYALKLDSVMCITYSAEETRELAEKYATTEDNVIYAVGGDGTLHQVLNGIGDRPAMLSVIPVGCGNDFYRSLDKYPQDIVECPVMKVNDQLCINIFSLGLDAEICKNAEKMKKIGIPAGQIYNASILYSYFKHKPKFMIVDIDGDAYYDLMNIVAICQGQYYGNGFCISPNASFDTDEAKICMAANISKLGIPGKIMKIIRGTHESDRHVEVVTGRKIKIVSDDMLVGNVDGEIFEGTEFEIDTCVRRIRVLNPRDIISGLKDTK